MSDQSQGPGWWQASDGKWYPPEQAPGGAAPQPGPQPAAAAAAGAAASPHGPLAEFGPRAIGFIIDWALVVVPYIALWIVSLILGQIAGVLGLLVGLVAWAVALGGWLYMAYLVGTKGQSPGMAMQGIRCVVLDTGQPPGAGMGIARSLITGIIPCALGYLAFFVGEQRQTVGDMVAKSVVVADQPKASFSVDLLKV